MKIYNYDSYEEYIKYQTECNKLKLKRVYMRKEIVQLISDYTIKNIPLPKFGICHGVRNAWEVRKFRESLGFNIIGTEISDTAVDFAHTIQWDFHKIKDEWIDKVDFIYSNSLDHSYNPEMCLSSWVTCLTKHGCCFIEWSLMSKEKENIKSMKADCFGADLDEYRSILLKNFNVIDELEITLSTDWVENRGLIDERIIFVLKR